LNSLSDPRVVRIAVIGALVAALGLAGCGRKGPLDPPPGASSAAASPAAPPPEPAIGPDGQPLPPSQQPPRKRTVLDWLID
jgi:predicted small lipoprotein YifL